MTIGRSMFSAVREMLHITLREVTALKKTETGVRGRLRLLGFLRLGCVLQETGGRSVVV